MLRIISKLISTACLQYENKLVPLMYRPGRDRKHKQLKRIIYFKIQSTDYKLWAMTHPDFKLASWYTAACFSPSKMMFLLHLVSLSPTPTYHHASDPHPCVPQMCQALYLGLWAYHFLRLEQSLHSWFLVNQVSTHILFWENFSDHSIPSSCVTQSPQSLLLHLAIFTNLTPWDIILCTYLFIIYS